MTSEKFLTQPYARSLKIHALGLTFLTGHLKFAPTEKAVYILVPKGLRNGTRIIMP